MMTLYFSALMNNRFNNVSAIRGTPICFLDVPTRASTTSYQIGPNASAKDLAAIQEMETRLAMQEQAASAKDLAAIQEMETRLAIQKHAVAHPIHIRVATPGAFEFRVATPAASGLSSVHFAQPHVQPARVRHIDASEAAIAWGRAQTRHTQLRQQLRELLECHPIPSPRVAWQEQYRAKFRECEHAAHEEVRLAQLLQQARGS